MDSPYCLASQHIKREQNVVTNLLSFKISDQGYLHPLTYDSPADDVLAQQFHPFLPTQIPCTFTILPLPNKILSWTTPVLRVGELSLTADRSRRTITRTESEDAAGNTSAPMVVSKMTPSSLLYSPTSKSLSCGSSLALIERLNYGHEEVDLREAVARLWSEALYVMPQSVWLLRSKMITGPAPWGVPHFSPSPTTSPQRRFGLESFCLKRVSHDSDQASRYYIRASPHPLKF
jgi:hypothetical protein